MISLCLMFAVLAKISFCWYVYCMDCAVVNDCDYDIDAVTVNVDTI